MKAILSSTYFGPVQWYQKLNRYEECLIERHESFIKQTYRNRMIIPTTNGPLSLTIPTNHDTSLAMKRYSHFRPCQLAPRALECASLGLW